MALLNRELQGFRPSAYFEDCLSNIENQKVQPKELALARLATLPLASIIYLLFRLQQSFLFFHNF